MQIVTALGHVLWMAVTMLGVLMWVLISWQFAAAEFIGGPVMIVAFIVLMVVFFRTGGLEMMRMMEHGEHDHGAHGHRGSHDHAHHQHHGHSE